MTRYSFFSFKNLGLRGRALLVCTLPVITVGLVLAGIFVAERFKELDITLETQGKMITAAFSHSFFELDDLWSGEKPAFLAQRILEEDNVRSVALYDTNGNLIIRTGPKMLPLATSEADRFKAILHTPTVRYSKRSLRITQAINPASSFHPLAKTSQHKGWLEVEIDRSNLVIAKYKSIVFTALLLLIALAINIMIALRFANNIGAVMRNVKSALHSMGKGNYYLQLEENAFGELKELQVALNSLNAAILEGQKELQQSVDQTTEDLTETLETIEIQNIELDLARKEALQASRVKSEFLANMSHEIRTPLNGIIGFTNLLLKSNLSTTQRDYLETIQKSSQSLLSIINDILDFSKIEAGKLVLDSVPLNFQEIIEEVLTMLAPMAYEKRLEQISLVYSDVPTNIIGDPLRLKQILTNLINNAIKFTDEGEVVIRVMLDGLKDDTVSLNVKVTDTGIGLSKNQQRTLFSAFRQADTTTARRFGGTGLGLVISKHLIEQMRGDIGMESEPGKGSTFWFRFRSKLHNQSLVPPPLELTGSCHIAVYDSNPLVRANLCSSLEKHSATVSEYETLEALMGADMTELSAVIIGVNARHPRYGNLVKFWLNAEQPGKILIHGNPVDQIHLSELLDGHKVRLIPKPLVQKRMFDQIHECLQSWQLQSLPPPTAVNLKTLPEQRVLNILTVDDNDANLKLLAVLLQDLGVNAISCDSGEEAIKQFSQHAHIDLVLMDIQMPVMDGIETTSRIRSLELPGRHTPIIAVTAHALASEKQVLRSEGLDDYLTKPLGEAELIHCIQKWTDHQIEPTTSNAETKQTASLPAPDSNVVDLALGLELANNKVDLAEELLGMLYDSLRKDLPSITDAVRQNHYDRLQDIIHKLHGATKYTGVPLLQASALAVETALKQQNFSIASELTASLIKEIEKVIVWYEENRNPENEKSDQS